jgi:hypothetical protein
MGRNSSMSNIGKLIIRVGLVAIFSAMPLAAQVLYSVKFTTPFPFYLGDTEMPSGSYSLTQPEDLNKAVAVIRSADGSHAAFVDVNPTESLDPPRKSKVTFEKYGNTLYFNRVILEGDPHGIVALKSKAEKKAKETASVVEERSITVAGQ